MELSGAHLSCLPQFGKADFEKVSELGHVCVQSGFVRKQVGSRLVLSRALLGAEVGCVKTLCLPFCEWSLHQAL